MRTKVVIGFLSNTIKGSVPSITQSLIDGISDRYDMVPYYMERKIGETKHSSFNLVNIFYFIKHYFSWVILILRTRPCIVHYPVTSYLNLEKSLLFLATARALGAEYTIGHLHGGSFLVFWDSMTSLRRKVVFHFLNRLNLFIVLSESWKVSVLEVVGLHKEKVEVLHNIIEEKFEKAFSSYRREYYQNDRIHIIGFNLYHSKKGIFDIIKAASILSGNTDLEISIAGEEKEKGIRKKALALIERLNLTNIKLLEGIYGDAKINSFKHSDLLILPSYVENFPMVIIEAACAGLPIITTPVGALPDLFTHMTNIWFCDPGNVQQIGEAIDTLSSDASLRRRLGQGARKVFDEKLARNEIIDRLDNIYKDLLKP